MASPVAARPAGHVQGSPFEEARFVQQQADDDDGNEGGGGVPDDRPDRGDVLQRYSTHQQGEQRAEAGAPADTQAFGLPDDQNQSEQKDGGGS